MSAPGQTLDVCRCSHAAEAHEHYRPGSDCALCECRQLEAPVECKHLAPRSQRINGDVTCDACLEVVGNWKADRRGQELDLINYSEWLDTTGLLATPKDDRTHEQLVREFLAEKEA